MKEVLRRFDEVMSEKVSKSSLAEYKVTADKTYMMKEETKDFV
jgi:hypothetical protein